MPRLETTITSLEMRAPPRLHVPAPAGGPALALMRAQPMPVGYYRYLYDAVGRAYHWVDRKRLTDAELGRILDSGRTEITVLYVGGVPAGYFELEARLPPAIAIAYFGLAQAFHGHGLGRFLLAATIEAAWTKAPDKVTVETCTLDHPAALPLYQKLGFVPVSRRRHFVTTLG